MMAQPTNKQRGNLRTLVTCLPSHALELFLTQSWRPIKRSNVIKAHLFTFLTLPLDDGGHSSPE